MLAEDRRKKILEILMRKQDTTVEDLSGAFNKAIPTIYKDLKILEHNKKLKKVYGGVKIFDSKLEKGFYDYYNRVEENKRIKSAISREAVKIIADGDIIAIDASTTAHYIIEELKNENKKNITIITNSAVVTNDNILLGKENINIFITGGLLEKKTACFLEANPKKILPDIQINKFFFSTFGFSLEEGVMDSFLPQNCRIKRAFFEMSLASYCLVSSDKFGVSGALNWAGLNEIKTIISDENIDKKIVKYLQDKNINTIIAKL